ncbi:hypothetical protein D3C71_1978040 [compost metagenome]
MNQNNFEYSGYKDIEDDLRGYYEYLDHLMVNDDDISSYIISLVWTKLKLMNKQEK